MGQRGWVRSASCAVAPPAYRSDKHRCQLPGNVRGRKRCCTEWQEGKESKTGTVRERESTNTRDTKAGREIKDRGGDGCREERSKMRKRTRRGSSNIIKHLCMKQQRVESNWRGGSEERQNRLVLRDWNWVSDRQYLFRNFKTSGKKIIKEWILTAVSVLICAPWKCECSPGCTTNGEKMKTCSQVYCTFLPLRQLQWTPLEGGTVCFSKEFGKD